MRWVIGDSTHQHTYIGRIIDNSVTTRQNYKQLYRVGSCLGILTANDMTMKCFKGTEEENVKYVKIWNWGLIFQLNKAWTSSEVKQILFPGYHRIRISTGATNKATNKALHHSTTRHNFFKISICCRNLLCIW